MGIDIGIALYDKEREDEIERLQRALKGYEHASSMVKDECPFDIRGFEARLKELLHLRYAFTPPTELTKRLAGARWWNLNIFVNAYMEFKLEEKVIIPNRLLDFYIKALKRFVLAVAEDDNADHVQMVYDFFIELKEHNLMIYPT